MQGTDGLTTPPASPDLALRYRQFQEKRSMIAVASTPQDDDEEPGKGLHLMNLLSEARSRARKERRKKRKELERQLATLREGASQNSQDATSSSSTSPSQVVIVEQGKIAVENVDVLPQSSVERKTKEEVEEQNKAKTVVDTVTKENVRPAEPVSATEDGTPPDVAKPSTETMSLVTPGLVSDSITNPTIVHQETDQLGSRVSGPVTQRRFMHYDDDSGSPWSGGMVTRSRKKARTPLLVATTNSLIGVSIQDNKHTSVVLDFSSKSPDRSAAAVFSGKLNEIPRSARSDQTQQPSTIQHLSSTEPNQLQQQKTNLMADRPVNKSEKESNSSKVGVSMFTTGKGSSVYVSKTSMERATTSFGSITNSESVKSTELKSNSMEGGQFIQPQTIMETPIVASIPVQQQLAPMVDSIFTSGSGKRMKISSTALENAARAISTTNTASSSSGVTGIATSNLGNNNVGSESRQMMTTMFGERADEQVKPAKMNMVDSIFTSGSGRKCKVSAASLEKAHAQMVVGGSSSSTLVAQGLSTTQSLGVQQRIISTTTTAPRSVDASPSVRLESTTTTTAATSSSSSSSFGMIRPAVAPFTTTKQFVRPRPAAATAPGSNAALLNRSVAQPQQRLVGDMPGDTRQRRGSTSPSRPSTIPRRQPMLDSRPKMPALRVLATIVRNNPLVSDLVKSVSSSNAVFVSFAPKWDRPTGILSGRPCLETLQALQNHCLAQVPQAKSLTLEWVANHFRWIVLKFAGQERLGLNQACLTFSRVADEMKKRAERELLRREYSCLWHIVGGEASPQRPMILFLSRILSLPRVTNTSKSESACIVELSDSWYGMECVLDGPLTELVRKGSLVPGQKVLVTNCTLDTPLSESTAFHPLDLSCNRLLSSSSLPLGNQRQPKLMLKSNASKPAPWDSRLGFYVYNQSPVGMFAPRQISKRLSQIKPGGGIVTRTDLLIVRRSLLLFREECPDGTVVIRSQQDEETYAASIEARKMEHVQSLETNFQKTISDGDSNMSRDIYQRKLNEYLAQHGVLSSNVMSPRKVTSFIRLLVRDASNQHSGSSRTNTKAVDMRTCLLTVWRPNEETMSLIQEGRICVVTGLAVSNNSSALGGNHREHPLQQLRLHAYPNSTKWYRTQASPGIPLEGYVPRRFQECVEENSSCDSCLIALRSSPDVIFAIRPISIQEDDQLTVIAIAPASTKTRLMFQPNIGSVFAVRDLAVKSKTVQGYVLNAVALDTTAFLAVRSPGFSTYPREVRESFGHLLDYLEAARSFTLSPAGRALVERALIRVDLLMKGEVVEGAVPSGMGEGSSLNQQPEIAAEQVEVKTDEQICDGFTPNNGKIYADLGRSMEFLDCEKSCGPMEVESLATPQQSGTEFDQGTSGCGSAPLNDLFSSAVNGSNSTLMMITPQQPNRIVPALNPFETPRYTTFAEPNSTWSAPPQAPSTHATMVQMAFSSPPSGVVMASPLHGLPPSVSRGNGGVMGPPDLVSTSGSVISSSSSSSTTKRPNSNSNVRMKLGISTTALSSLQVGRKTIEARLNRGLFSKIQPGWSIRFESGPMFQEVEVVAIRSYASFKMLLEKEPFKRVSPWCETVEQALEEFNTKNGSLDMEHSVLAFEIRCKDAMSTPELVLPRRQQQQQVSTTTSTSGSSSA